jgi:O-antigen/teichoic acid export membrane protein
MSAGVVGVVSYACSLLMANMLPTTDYTHFASAAMLMGIVGIVASALVPLPLSHVVAVSPEGSEERKDGMAFSVFVSCIAGAVAAAATGMVTLAFATPALAGAVALGSFAIFIVTAPSGWLQGELRFTWVALTNIGEVVLRLGFSALVIVLAWGAGGAVLGFAVGSVAPLAVPLSFYRDLHWRPRVLLDKWRWAETIEIASVLCVVSILVGIDVVVVGFLDEGSSAAAGFQALASIAKGPVYVAAGTALVVFPLLRTSGADVRRILGAAFTSFGQLALVAFVIIATAPHMLSGLIVPEKYHGSLELLPWLAVAGLGYAVLMVLSTVLLAVRAYRRCQMGLAIACLLVVGGLWAGWHVNAVAGMAVGSAAGSVLASLVLAYIAHPVLAATARPGTVAWRWLAYPAGLIAVLGVASQMQPWVWLLLASGAGLAVLAHQRGLLPGRSVAGIPRRRLAGESARSTGRRSKQKTSLMDVIGAWRMQGLPGTLMMFLAVVAGAFCVRALGLERGFELWVDELLYVRLGESVSAGQFPTLPDGPFFLHPPGYFILEAAVIKLFDVSGEIVDVLLQLRWLNATLGALTVGLGFLLVRRLTGTAPAWFCAVLLAFEPFILRNNSHAFLETSAMAAVLAGFLVLVGMPEPARKRAAFLRWTVAGLLLGYGVLCKDFFIICTIAPVLVAVLWKETLPWRKATLVVAATVIPYAAYLAVVAVREQMPGWVWAKSNGLVRMSGVEKSTGFTAEGSPSILSRLIEQSGHFGTSYVLLALCPVAGLLLCFSLHAGRRFIGLAGLALGAAGAYSAVFGTFEEQYGYGVMVAGALCSVLAVVELQERYPKGRRFLAVFSMCFVALTVILGMRTALTVDNGFAGARQWVKANLPADARVSVTNSTAELIFMDDARFGIWPSAPLMKEHGAGYILTQSLPTSQGYGYANPTMLAWLKDHATPVFTSEGPTNGDTTLWFVHEADLDAAASANIGFPSKDHGTER